MFVTNVVNNKMCAPGFLHLKCLLRILWPLKGPVIIYRLGGVGGFWAKHDEI